MIDLIQWCNNGDTYKCCCVMLQDKDKCCYQETCDDYKGGN